MKRACDFLVSLIGLIFLLPIFLVIAVVIKISDGGPVFFTQERVGKEFKPFKLYKFRTMVKDAVKKGPAVTASNDLRITKIGGFLRRTKLDELPQLINIFKGNMSIVGPRPEVSKYVQLFKSEYDEILKIRPGLTDYATIEFINEETILGSSQCPEEIYVKEVLPAKIDLYRKYLNQEGIRTDLKIIFVTLRQLF